MATAARSNIKITYSSALKTIAWFVLFLFLITTVVSFSKYPNGTDNSNYEKLTEITQTAVTTDQQDYAGKHADYLMFLFVTLNLVMFYVLVVYTKFVSV